MKICFLPLCFLLFAPCLFANGGPVNPATVARVGDVQFVNMPNVRLLREDLHIRIDGEYSEVTVRYRLQNRDYDMDTLLYGFPVDFLMDPDGMGFHWQPDYVPAFEFAINGRSLPVRKQMDFSLMSDTLTTLDNNFTGQSEGVYAEDFRRCWFFTDVVVPRDSTAELLVRYRVKNYSNDFANSKEFHTHFSNRSFLYDFTPAAYWGDGKVADFRVTIDDSDVRRCQGKFSLANADFRRGPDSLWVFQQRDYDLKKAGNLLFKYDMDARFRSDDLRKRQIPSAFVQSVKASSTLSGGNYDAKNLLDGDFSTAWAEGQSNSGAGAWVEFQLQPGYYLESFAIANGYFKNRETYDNNCRVKRLRVEFEYPNRDTKKTEVFSDTIHFENLPWQPVFDYKLADMCPIYQPQPYDENGEERPWKEWYMERVTRVRLTILDTWPGKKYKDACISEVLLFGWEVEDED